MIQEDIGNFIVTALKLQTALQTHWFPWKGVACFLWVCNYGSVSGVHNTKMNQEGTGLSCAR